MWGVIGSVRLQDYVILCVIVPADIWATCTKCGGDDCVPRRTGRTCPELLEYLMQGMTAINRGHSSRAGFSIPSLQFRLSYVFSDISRTYLRAIFLMRSV